MKGRNISQTHIVIWAVELWHWAQNFYLPHTSLLYQQVRISNGPTAQAHRLITMLSIGKILLILNEYFIWNNCKVLNSKQEITFVRLVTYSKLYDFWKLLQFNKAQQLSSSHTRTYTQMHIYRIQTTLHERYGCHLSETDSSISNAYIWIYQISNSTESSSSGVSERRHAARTQINISQCNLTTKTILHLKYLRLDVIRSIQLSAYLSVYSIHLGA